MPIAGKRTVNARHQNRIKGLQTRPKTEQTSRSLKMHQSLPRLIFLDLDNTLIPTQWIMEQWQKRLAGDSLRAISYINKRLEAAGLFATLDKFLHAIVRSARGLQRIVIVTNAAAKTVTSFYLALCIPQLDDLLRKYRIPIHSTEKWLSMCGAVPDSTEEDQFREYYTRTKLMEFQKEFQKFQEWIGKKNSEMITTACESGSTTASSPGESSSSMNAVSRFDVISVGDQLCEMTAAIRLSVANEPLVRHTKLLMILDSIENNEVRPCCASPENFVRRLSDTLANLLDLIKSSNATVTSSCLPTASHVLIKQPATNPTSFGPDCSQQDIYDDIASSMPPVEVSNRDSNNGPGEHCRSRTTTDYYKTAMWVARNNAHLYCVGKPKHFISLADSCFFDLPLYYSPSFLGAPSQIVASSLASLSKNVVLGAKSKEKSPKMSPPYRRQTPS